ncbi:hypothetical protein D3C72_2022990 [compost metagenome]
MAPHTVRVAPVYLVLVYFKPVRAIKATPTDFDPERILGPLPVSKVWPLREHLPQFINVTVGQRRMYALVSLRKTALGHPGYGVVEVR